MIPLSRPHFDNEEIEEVKRVLESGWVSQGPKVKEMEDFSCAYLGVKYAICVANCTAALHLALLSIGVGKGDEVIVSDFTFPATGHSVLYCDGNPIFADVNSKTYNMNTDVLESLITSRTKAIIPVHAFGQSAKMDTLMEIASEHGLKVIEDAACAFGTKYKGRYSGTIGDIGCFSFHARKGITTGEGGMVVTNDRALADHIRYIAVFGMKAAWERENAPEFSVPEFYDVGYNYKMSDITAAVGVAQLRKLDRIIKRKRELAHMWNEEIEKIENIEAPFEDPEGLHIYQSYVAKVAPIINRNRLITELKKREVQSQIGTYASHIQPVYRYPGSCPISLSLQNQAISLPLFYEMTEHQMHEACDALRAGLRESL